MNEEHIENMIQAEGKFGSNPNLAPLITATGFPKWPEPDSHVVCALPDGRTVKFNGPQLQAMIDVCAAVRERIPELSRVVDPVVIARTVPTHITSLPAPDTPPEP